MSMKLPEQNLIHTLARVRMHLDPTLQADVEDRRGEPPWAAAPDADAPWLHIARWIFNNEMPYLGYRPYRMDAEAPYGSMMNPGEPPPDEPNTPNQELADLWDQAWSKEK